MDGPSPSHREGQLIALHAARAGRERASAFPRLKGKELKETGAAIGDTF